MLEAAEIEEDFVGEEEKKEADLQPGQVMIDTSGKKQESAAGEANTIVEKRSDGNSDIETIMKLQTKMQEVYRKFSKVCTELKLLYVAITRPKNLLLIYDQDNSFRKPIQRCWETLKVVDVVTQNQL